MKKFLSVLLCLLICIGILGTAAAEEASDSEENMIYRIVIPSTVTPDEEDYYYIDYYADYDLYYLGNTRTENQLRLFLENRTGVQMMGVELANIGDGALHYDISFADAEHGYSAMDFMYDVENLSGLRVQVAVTPVDREAVKDAQWTLVLLGSMEAEEIDVVTTTVIPDMEYQDLGQPFGDNSGWKLVASAVPINLRGFTIVPDTYAGGFYVQYGRAILFFDAIEALTGFVDGAWEYSLSSALA